MRFTTFIAAMAVAVTAAASAQEPVPNREVLSAEMRVSPDGGVVETLHSERHAGNDAGALMASRAALPYNAQMQELEIVEAYTLKPDGRKIAVDLSSAYEQLSRDGGPFATYADLRSKMIQFPQFAAGDTAVFTARLKTAHPLFAGQFVHGNVFPASTGHVDIRETIIVPRSMVLHTETHDMEFSKREQGADVVYSWHHVQEEPRPAAPVIVSAVDREPRFFVSTFKDYAELGRAYSRLQQPKLVVTAKVKALADQITAGDMSRRAQAEKIFAWVSKNIRYVAIELGRGSMEPHDVDSILANGYGDCKDHDLLLRALLKAKGIAAESILVNSGSAYSLTAVPSFVQLNHVITRIPEFDAYLDSSFSMAPFGVLPTNEYGKPAVRVGGGGAEQFTMPVLPEGLSNVSTATKARLDGTGQITGTTTTTASGPSSIILRVEGLALETIGPEKAADLQLSLRGLKGANGVAQIGSPMEVGPTYAISTSISSQGWSDWVAGKARRTLPGAATVLNAEPAIGGLYLTAPDSEAVPCASVHAIEDVSLALPPGTRPEQLPADASVQTPHVSFTAHWSFAGGALELHRDYTSRFDAPLCTGAVRTEVAAALKKINETYKTELQLRPAGAASAQSDPQPVARAE